MDKNQNRSISANFFDLRDTVDDGSAASQANIVEVNQSEVDQGDTSVSLTQDQSEPILTKTTDLVETTSDSLEDQGASLDFTKGFQNQQLEPLRNGYLTLFSSEPGLQVKSIAYGNFESVSVEKQIILKISGTDKQQVGMVAAEIKSIRPPEPYKGKGIKEQGQYILRKEGKKK